MKYLVYKRFSNGNRSKHPIKVVEANSPDVVEQDVLNELRDTFEIVEEGEQEDNLLETQEEVVV